MPDHPVLDNYDILCEIFTYLDPYAGEPSHWPNSYIVRPLPGSRATLSRAARVCKSFSEPALDVLWRRLGVSAALALFGTLPNFRDGDMWNGSHLEGEIHESSLLRFTSYARRVHEASIKDGDAHALITTPGIPKDTLLPFLRILEWDRAEADDRSLVPLLSPSLQMLAVGLSRGPASPEDELLKTAARRAPHLKALHIDLRTVMPLWHLSAFSKLTRLEITLSHKQDTAVSNKLDAGAMKAIFALEQLEELDICAIIDENKLACGVLPNLRKLGLSSSFVDGSICSLIASIAAPRLQELCIKNLFSNDSRLTHTAQCATKVAACYGASVRSITFRAKPVSQFIHIYHDMGWPEDNIPPSQVLKIFRPLLYMPHIQHAYLQVATQKTSLSDVEAQEIAAAWPQLENLCIETNRQQEFASQSAWAVPILAPFARLCPALHTLRILCDIVEPFGDAEVPSIRNVALRQLEIAIADGEIANPEGLAEQLSFLFPKLDLGLSLKQENWGRVRQMMSSTVC